MNTNTNTKCNKKDKVEKKEQYYEQAPDYEIVEAEHRSAMENLHRLFSTVEEWGDD